MPPSLHPGSNPRVLLVSHNFPPTAGPESYLVHLNALSLHRAGMDVSVLTTSQQFKHARQRVDETLLRELPEDIQILRTTSYDAMIKSASPRLGGRGLQLMERTFLPEMYMFWLASAFPAGKKHLEHSPSIIYSRAQKHVSNVCGWRLNKATGMPWIAHFSDIWVTQYMRSPVVRSVARALERRILRDADRVVFVTHKAVDHVMRLYPESWRPKVHVIPHGYAREVPSAAILPGSRPLHLLHAGVFYPGSRTPETLFRALEKLNRQNPLQGRLKLTLLGGQGSDYLPLAQSLGIANIVEFKASVPHEECQRLIGACDLPVMIDTLGHDGVFLPSKLIEYFAFQKPVLVLTERNSAVSQTLQDCHLPVADLTDPQQIATTLEASLKSWETGTWTLSPDTLERMASYQIDRVNQPLFEMMGDLWPQVPHPASAH